MALAVPWKKSDHCPWKTLKLHLAKYIPSNYLFHERAPLRKGVWLKLVLESDQSTNYIIAQFLQVCHFDVCCDLNFKLEWHIDAYYILW